MQQVEIKKQKGFYGAFGGQFIPETLIPALDELEKAFIEAKEDENFLEEFHQTLKYFAGRTTPLYYAKNLSRDYGIEIYLKREDLLHTGAHKLNNTIGQAMLTRYMNKNRVIAETGAGQHGVATATVASKFNLDCTIYMGEVDAERQAPNVKRMNLLGAEVKLVKEGSKTLKDAMNSALRDWVANVVSTHYMIGSAAGPYPFPELVAFFQSVIGKEAREQSLKLGFLPDHVVACVGGGSNAIGIFRGFVNDKEVNLIGVEAGGTSDESGHHSKTLCLGKPGILHGALSYLLQNENNQVSLVHSISAGLDYPGVGPEHSFLKETGRAHYVSANDEEALFAFRELSKKEGIIPALESSHALAYVLKNKERFQGDRVVVNLSGRGDKDMGILEREGYL